MSYNTSNTSNTSNTKFANVTDTSLERLRSILSIKRGYRSLGDYEVRDLILTLHPYAVEFSAPDGEPLALVIRNGGYPVLWSCHTDTVHSAAVAGIFHAELNPITFDTDTMMAYMDNTMQLPGCLGADDGAGIWLLLEMLDADVPGTYVFHYGEERGGIGSSGMAAHHEDFLKEFTHAIAFDRRGTEDVITHQARGRCCSDAFAKQFAALLNTTGDMAYKPCSTGIFTDTANYIDAIAECSNISCGYYSEHSVNEYLDMDHLVRLRDVLVAAFKSAPALVAERVPGTVEPAFEYDYYTGTSDSRFDYYKPYAPRRGNEMPEDLYQLAPEDIANISFRKLRKMVRDDPDAAADLLIEMADRLIEANLYNDKEIPDDTDDFNYNNLHNHNIFNKE